MYGDFSTKNRCAIVTLNIGDYDSSEVSDELLTEYGISTRSGGHCAPLMHEALGTVEQGAVRFSFSHYNTEEEVDTAIRAIRRIGRRIKTARVERNKEGNNEFIRFKEKTGTGRCSMRNRSALLAYFGNPANMACCIACFIRDTAGALGMHQAEAVQYARPEIIGLVLGSFLISVATKEYRSTAGSSPMIRFVLGMIIMIGALVFLDARCVW